VSRLIAPDELVGRLGDPTLALLEVSFVPDESSHRAGHIPGAGWAYWKTLLWDDRMRQLATGEQTGSRLGELGVGAGQTLVVYGDPVQFGSYALWVLEMAGQRDVRMLDGGKEYWLAAGLPLEKGAHIASATGPRPAGPGDRSDAIGRDDVLAAVARRSHVILDLRAPEEYVGERVSPGDGFDHGAERTGRIPGAHHLYFRELLSDTGRLRTREEILSALAARDATPDDAIITYCRLSHRASLGWLALTEVAGASDVRVYDGSWTEWGSMVGMPIER
jgi:thiosulfate/3-mercaptopyruvate sulfurtransferase